MFQEMLLAKTAYSICGIAVLSKQKLLLILLLF